ncbi:MAG: hypothetical protein C3F12_06185 [Candidatus Methylomirabilota bacterium]|nr:hypothetical protein [Candidatus Methylomirabilis sp.]NJD69178.1 hypothetical protein [candidate division NC10 bacterium]PWB47549.1 MAG: hypothetical protein C3F12_06185 [candidate division NC10 bacterium]
MLITKDTVAEQLAAYLEGKKRLGQVVSWAHDAFNEGEFDEADIEVIRDVVARLGLADVTAFGLTWEDAVEMLGRLGYRASVHVQPAKV